MSVATEAERRRLGESFAELCAIPSPSGDEAACARHVAEELRRAGVAVESDVAGNLLARLGEGQGGVLLCAHVDTVPPTAPIEPVLGEDGFWANARPGILGADNKAAVAVILAAVRRLARDGVPVPLEILFTVAEETALAGAKAFDAARLRSDFGYVFDHATPIGEVVLASPTDFHVRADFRGQAAHAGIRPEDGRSAILAAARAVASLPHGRVDPDTTVNAGRIEGGTAINVVPERCHVDVEVRSLDRDRAEAMVAEVVDRTYDAANASETDVDVTVERKFEGYRLKAGTPAVEVARRALRARGYEPRPIASGGGSDANVLVAGGFACVNLANGTERAHQADERVSRLNLEAMLDLLLALVEEAARELRGAPSPALEGAWPA